ncbi:ABC transporter permease [Actinomyces procaprae]|uniref:ABC transporter permease n=1 Tax=Actinomyces procaprae TaxID=2560010 RepID=UPI00109DDC29|nr:ABC transporter permease [Actinomyces procaprae]
MSPTRSLPLSVLRAAARQAYGDLRPQWFTVTLLPIFGATGLIMAARLFTAPEDVLASGVTRGAVLIAGSVGVLAGLVIFLIVNETYMDRVSGALLRVRLLPHGPMVWAVGKAFSVVTQMVVLQVPVLIGLFLCFDLASPTPARIALCLFLIGLSVLACAPLGFLLGVLVRGVYTAMMLYAVIIVGLAFSGFLLPMTEMPAWVQVIQAALPPYWSGHLTRWALVDDPSWEIGGAFHPALAVGVLLAWVVVGFALVPPVIRRSFRKETIGGLSRMQSTIRSQSGL